MQLSTSSNNFCSCAFLRARSLARFPSLAINDQNLVVPFTSGIWQVKPSRSRSARRTVSSRWLRLAGAIRGENHSRMMKP
jgi:hypothetical protein